MGKTGESCRNGERREHREWKTDVDLSSLRNAPAQGRGGLQEGRIHGRVACGLRRPGYEVVNYDNLSTGHRSTSAHFDSSRFKHSVCD